MLRLDMPQRCLGHRRASLEEVGTRGFHKPFHKLRRALHSRGRELTCRLRPPLTPSHSTRDLHRATISGNKLNGGSVVQVRAHIPHSSHSQTLGQAGMAQGDGPAEGTARESPHGLMITGETASHYLRIHCIRLFTMPQRSHGHVKSSPCRLISSIITTLSNFI